MGCFVWIRAHCATGLLATLLAACGGGGGGAGGGGGNTPVAPVITSQPQSTTVTPNSGASFAVTASGTAPLSYQWRRDGADIVGATADGYAIAAVAGTDSGALFSVVVSNAAGSVNSANATLTVSAVASRT